MNNRFNGNRYNFNGQFGREGFNLNTLKSIPLTYIILFINIVFYIVSVGFYTLVILILIIYLVGAIMILLTEKSGVWFCQYFYMTTPYRQVFSILPLIHIFSML